MRICPLAFVVAALPYANSVLQYPWVNPWSVTDPDYVNVQGYSMVDDNGQLRNPFGPWFRTEPGYSHINGGCNDRKEFPQAYAEAMLTLQICRNAVENIKRPRAEATNGDYFEWDRQARAMNAFFKAGIDPDTGEVVKNGRSSGTANLRQQIIDTITKILDLATAESPWMRARFFCSDAGLYHRRPEESNPCAWSPLLSQGYQVEPDRFRYRIKDDPSEEVRALGAFVAPAAREDWRTYPPRALGCRPDGLKVCTDRVEAVTVPAWKSIIFCPHAYETKLVSVIAAVQQGYLTAGMKLNAARSYSSVLVHELIHLVDNDGSFNDKIGVNPDSKATPKGKYNVNSKSRDRSKFVYGVGPAMLLAQHYPAQAASSPENIALFCQAILLDQFDWSDGGIAQQVRQYSVNAQIPI